MKRYPLKTLAPLGHQWEASISEGFDPKTCPKLWYDLICTRCGTGYMVYVSGKIYIDEWGQFDQIINLSGGVKASCTTCSTNHLFDLLTCDEVIIKDIIE
jgi:hypothetical protein